MVEGKKGILFGGDYNPEQWPEQTWQEDIDKLKQAQINEATINVFSWSLLESREGKFNFEFLDKIVALLVKNHIKIMLATATAAIPAWVIRKYPSVARVNRNGIQQRQGKRHNACPNSPDFKRLVTDLVTRLAKRYADTPGLTYWHVSNEYSGYCYCDNCAREFRIWLQHKYKTLAKLNHAWNSNLWSHTIYDWGEIEPPMLTTDIFPNGKPTLSGAAIDYRRFQSDSLLANYQLERNLIKKYDQQHPVTTNLMGTQKDLDYFKWAPELDIVSWDSYPLPNQLASQTAMNHDLMRGLKNHPFLLMEQSPNQQNWYPYNTLKKPGEMRMLSYQAIAHGANTIQFFQLKQSRSGAEKFHGSVLTHSNSIHTRTFREVQMLGRELAQLPESLLTTDVEAKVAIIFDWDSYWGLENCIGPLERLSYLKEVQRFYTALYQQGLSIDMVSKHADFSKYRLVIAPVLYMVDEQFVAEITDYVRAGGNFLTTYLSGIADDTDNVYLGGYPGPLRQLLGITIDERDARPENQTVRILSSKQEQIGLATGICDLVIPQKARVLAHYGQDVFYSDSATITQNSVGNGYAYYCGASLNQKGLSYLLRQISKTTSLSLRETNSVEVCSRRSDAVKFTFVINTSNQVQSIDNPAPENIELLSNRVFENRLILDPYQVLIFQQ